MLKLQHLLLLTAFFMFSLFSYAQDKTISGTILDETDNTLLEGVTVTNKNSNQRTKTNKAGYYSIKAENGHLLVFTYVGYSSKQITVTDGKIDDVKLLANDKNLDNVVVTAYGIKKDKKGLGYATQEVKGDEVAQTQRDNFLNALQGRIAGATVNQTSGAPGASSQIVLRGVNSISGNNSPLIIVDGLPINNNTFSQGSLASDLPNRNNDYTNRAADINPDDIESINVLKGPEATALYGIEAGSGAIVITTKRAKAGKLKVSYDNSFRVTHVYRYPEVQKVYDNGLNGSTVTTSDYRRLFGPRYAPGTVLYNNIENFFQDGFAQKHNLSMEGGTGKTAIRGSLTYRDEKGVVPNTGLNIVSTRFTINNKPIKKLDLSASIAYTYSKNDKAFRGLGGFLQNLMLWPYDDDAKNYLDANGKRRKLLASTVSELDNPFFDANKNKSYDKTHRGNFNLSASYDIKSWWNITARAGTDFYSQYGNYFLHPESNSAFTVGGQVEDYTEKYLSFNSVFLSTFKKNLGKLKNTLRIGAANDEWRKDNFSTRGQFLKDSVTNKVTNGTVFWTSRDSGRDTLTQRRLQGVFGELNLNYNDIVYLNFTGRNDWTSTLPIQARSFFYPSVSTAFIFSDLFAKNSKVFPLGKLRASYAETAKDIRPYGSQSAYSNNVTNSNGYGFVYDFTNNNPLIVPERQRTYEFGTELWLFDSRVKIDATYYNTRNIGQIVEGVRLSYATGYVLNTSNIADTKNTGYEISLNMQPVKSKTLVWNMIFNFAATRNKVTKLPGNIPEFYNSDTFIGNFRNGLTRNGSITQITGLDYLRNNAGQIIIDPANGLPLSATDFVKIGDRNPDFTLGIYNNITFKKGLTLSFLWDIKKGGDILNANEIFMYQQGISVRTLDREVPRIVPGVLNDGLQNTANPTINTIQVVPMFQSAYYTDRAFPVDFVEHDVNWLRLRDVTLRYTLGPNLIKRFKLFSSADIFATATDLVLFTNYGGVDPTAAGNSAATRGSGSFGIDYGSLSTPRGINLGVRVVFANK
jgi:TonB-linked SusC/RagA family outer membrane protein